MRIWLRRLTLIIMCVCVGIAAVSIAGLAMGVVMPALLPLALSVLVGGMVAPIALAMIGPEGRERSQQERSARAKSDTRSVMSKRPDAVDVAEPTGRRGLGIAIAAVCIVAGFFVGVMPVFGSVPRFATMASEVPARLGGDVHGIWDSQLLTADLENLNTLIGDRELEYLRLETTSIPLGVIGGDDSMTIHNHVYFGGGLGESNDTRRSFADPMSFTIADLDPEIIRQSVESVYEAEPGAHISSVDIDIYSQALTITVKVKNTITHYDRVFDAKTGEQIQ